MSEIIPIVIVALLHFVCFILRPIFMLIYHRKLPGIPPINNHLLKLSATTLAKKIRNGELSSQTVVETYIQRVKEVNPLLNAVIEDRFEQAVLDAKTCDARLKCGEVVAATLEAEKPLYGVPVTIKESCSLKGLSLTGGLLSRKGMKATEDGSAVELLKDAGAIPLLVSNTSELCTSVHSYNRLFGTTKNPHDRRRTPGGSSGGEAALISAGASVLGIGSDLVGSIRIPASFTGIFGHKPTPGLVPIDGHFPIAGDVKVNPVLVLGPLARCVEDLCLAMKILSSKSEKTLHPIEPIDLKHTKVFYLDNIGCSCGIRSTTSDIRQAVHKAKSYLAEKGAHIEKLPQKWVRDMFPVVIAVASELQVPNLLNIDNPEVKKNAFLEFIKATIGLSQYTPMLAFLQLFIDTGGFVSHSRLQHFRQLKEKIREEVNNELRGNAVIISPTFPRVADYPQLMFFQIDSNIYSAFANIMQLPSTSVPIGFTKTGLPVGIQVTDPLDSLL
ncbi:Fatty-acid amide hydrolase 2 [Habropoda laboriosa]|uniref:Fatty-acid amide hydrolase 2 n=1 Tax=Habropoda laboriosa TaxID=597456 RepID=A0A0L7QQF4_9HYME|nr:Fatty-acid amide hydrolase 2 [Habropoda laboriosa]